MAHPFMVFGDKKSNTVLVTLWTPTSEVLKHADAKHFKVSAPLYSRKRGISPLVRTLLADKSIRYIFLTGADLDKSGDALVKLFTLGLKNHAIIDSDVVLDKEIKQASLKTMLTNVELLDFRNIKGKDWKKLNDLAKKIPDQKSYGKSETFPMPKLDPPTTMPYRAGGYFIHGRTLVQMHKTLVEHLARFGEYKNHLKHEPTKDLHAVMITVDTVTYDPHLPFSHKEGDAYQKQVMSLKRVGDAHYSYGERMQKHFGKDQIAAVIAALKEDAYTRKGNIVVFDPRKDTNGAPGVMYINISVADHKTVLTLHARCMEGLQGVAQTLYGFLPLQQLIARETGFPIGPMHAVFDCVYAETQALPSALRTVQKIPFVMKHDDPRGNVVIVLKDGHIHLTHVSQDDKVLAEYNAKTAKEIYRKLADLGVLFDDYHKFDVGAELQKAEECLRLGREYIQDRK